MRNFIGTVVLIIVISVVFAYGLFDFYSHKDPPPGWRVISDGKGKWAAVTPGGFVHSHARYYSLRSRQSAINMAWAQFEFEQQYDAEKNKWENLAK